jgi:hypothetical protein
MKRYHGRSAKGPVLRGYQFPVFYDLLWAMQKYRGETFTVLFPRQAGKNQLAAELVQALLRLKAKDGGSAIAASPTFAPQGLIALERTKASFERTDRVVLPGETRYDGPTIGNRAARVSFLSASPEAHVAGHTASIALIADEAQEIDEQWFERQFRPMAASTAANTLLFGTPWDGQTMLDVAVARNRGRDAVQTKGADDFHYQVPWRDVGESVAAYREFVLKERDRLGATNPYFKTQYELRTVESAGRLFSASEISALYGEHQRQKAPRPHERYVAGLDVAGEGAKADSSILTIARVCTGGRCEVVDQVAWQGVTISTLETSVTELVRRWRLERLVVDSTGMGGPIAAHLETALAPRTVERFTFTPASKSELGLALVRAAAVGSLSLYADDASLEALACRGELRACSRRYRPGGQMQWGDERGNDDYVVSLALALRAAQEAGEPRFATGRRRQ